MPPSLADPPTRRRGPIRRLRDRRQAAGPGPTDGTMPVGDHLGELRRRTITVGAVLVLGVAGAFVAADWLFAALNRPLGDRFSVITLGVTEPFFTTLTVAAWTALAVTLPVIVFHAYRFIAPALPDEVRRPVRAACTAIPGLFAAGVAFGYFFVLAPALHFLLGIGGDRFEVQVRASDYYGFVSMTLVAMGVAFLYPLALLVLGRIGIVSSQLLRENRRFALLGIAILAALLPTADPVSLVIEMVPMLALFEVSIILLRWQERRIRASA